jgi:PAS domain S-box-containing protein
MKRATATTSMPPLPSSVVADPAPATGEVSILLVDDDERNLLALEAILASPEHRLVKALTAEAALIAVMENDFAAIVLDVKMPDFSGIELARMIKQRKKTQHIPIILLTAYLRENEHAVLGYDAGAVDYLTKPVHPAVLRLKVGVFIDLFRKTRALLEVNRSMEDEIDERKAAEERFRVVFEASPSAKLVFDKDWVLVVANSQAQRLFGQDEGKLAGTTISDLIPANALPNPSSLLEGASNVGGPRHSKQALIQRGETKVPVEISFTPLHSAQGMRWLVSLVDITQRQLAEAALRSANEELAAKNRALERETEERNLRIQAEAANAAKDRFLAMLSHELRTPLAAVLNSVDLLDLAPKFSDEVRETLELIRRNVKLEARLIDDLLDLGRIRTSKLKLQLKSANAHDLLHYALEICRPEIERRGLKVEVELKATRPVLHADSTRLQQIFWNLLNNAVKFTPAGGTVSLRSRDDGDGIEIEVSDTGLGLEPAHLTRIFDAFEQVESQDTKGLGLGLAICKALTELHGGRIVARSAGPGQGATFFVHFPNSTDRPLPVETSDGPASGLAHPPSLKILVVEDHIDTAKTLCRLLGHFGFDVQSAHSVAEALAVAKNSPFDLLLTDMGLPDGSGDELFLELKRSQPGLLGVAITGYGMDEDISRSSAAGFLNHFTKPIDFAFLRERLGEIAKLTKAP